MRTKPSELFARQCFVSPEDAEPGLDAMLQRDLQSVVFASDYPHGDGTFPGSTAALLSAETLDAASRRRILRENGERLYGLDGS